MTLNSLRAGLADRYVIERELGRGGMATVYLAHDIKHDRQVAVKVLRPELAAVIGAERFLTEIRTTANLQHPHILPLFDSGAAGSSLFYVMPFVEGESLRDRLKREKQLPIGDAVRIASEVASALDYAHRHGVIHRDIKPENILLHDGRALVADFGIALAASKAGTRMTETGMSLGTPQYMSPEQAMGERELDARSDVYALGCVAYEMLTGEPPFSGPTAQAIVAKVMTAEPAEVTSLRKTIPAHVADAVHTALQKLPADRFPDAKAFADALADPAGARGPRAAPRSRPTPLNWWRSPLATALLVLLALGAGAILTAALRPSQPHLGSLRLALEFPAGQELRSLSLPSIAVPPDGSGLVYTGAGVTTSTRFLLRRWDRMLAEPIDRATGEVCCLAFSPSGDSVAYLSTPRQLNVLALAGGTSRTLSDSGLNSVTDWAAGLAWGSDGQLYASGTGGLLRIDPRTGAREIAAGRDSARGDLLFLWPEVLPGGAGALVTITPRQAPSDPERASIGIANFRTRRVDVVVPGVRAIYSPTGHLIVARSNGVLWAVPFDARALRATGPARELTDTAVLRRGNASPGVIDMALDRNGTLTYIAGGDGAYDAVWVDRSGRWRPFVEGLTGPLMNGVNLSADGRRLVLSVGVSDRTEHLWVQPTDGGPRVRLTFDGTVNYRPRWRPGTNSITYIADHGGNGLGGLRLFERDADGKGEVRPIVTGDTRSVGGQTWSPDGKWLVFRTNDQDRGGGDILAIRPGIDTVARALVATPAEELGPAISPDGRWLAYTSNESGRREVYVRPFPETSQARYQVSTGGGMTPVWSRDGRELFFIDAAQNMVAVPVTSGASFQSGPAETLFSVADYYTTPYQPTFDVARDGRFVMVRRAAGTAARVVVVFNFLDELKRRMAAAQ